MQAKYMKLLVLNSEKIIFPTVKPISSSYSSQEVISFQLMNTETHMNYNGIQVDIKLKIKTIRKALRGI